MNLLLMRHGIAGHSRDDFNRFLSVDGIQGVKRTARSLVEQLSTLPVGVPSGVFASPLLRSQQTAQIMIEEMNLDVDLETTELIRPESEVERFVSLLKHQDDNAFYLYVSHQPFVGVLMYHLTGTEEFMDTAELNCVSISSFSQGGGELKWKLCA